ncbi:N-formylglutamate amidohydrolase [Nitrospina watsonii]|uniref:N-formylglutamate amidohydrolase n=2 Tax=Nitrospina watsonii TaxID=1323948 RepID=A0ABM9HEV9_9BACT|nr:N-formylglutamate amidohydrolase [Nitrospina watsonii]
MAPLPCLITVPHGGTQVPGFLAGRFILSERDVFDDIDACTRGIYDLSDLVMVWKDTDIARPVVDLNRGREDRPPTNPDGVVKTHTCFNVPVYDPQQPLDDALADDLIHKYHQPFHSFIESVVKLRHDLRIAFDCHSMSEFAPPVANDAGQPRPTFCLGNRFGDSCPDAVARMLATSLCRVFELEEKEVTLNQPFAGGYITRRYGGRPLPWIQIEMNRKLYLKDPWFDTDTRTVDPDRLAFLRNRMGAALRLFFELWDDSR